MFQGSGKQTIFAIGDIHGNADKLDLLLTRLAGLDPTSLLIFLGDYLDRGAHSRQVLDKLIRLREACPDTVFLMGNHEAILLHYATSNDPEDLRLLRSIGFQATLDSYGAAGFKGLNFMPAEHQDFLKSLKRWHQLGEYVFFHAPLLAAIDPSKADHAELERMLGNRRIDSEGWKNKRETLVFGHVPLESPLVAPGLIGIDTGTGSGRTLTAVELPAVRFHHV
jgi:serine/threonine protein phosphatase 1